MMARTDLTLVLGLGESGLAMARWLARQGVALRVADSRDVPPGVDRLRAEVPDVEIVTGPFTDSLLDGVVRLAISPGIDPRQPLVQAAQARGVPVVGVSRVPASAPGSLPSPAPTARPPPPRWLARWFAPRGWMVWLPATSALPRWTC